MVQFNTSYFNTLDKPRPKEASIGEFGTSAKMGDILDALKGEINVGAKHVELGFTGKEKGSLSQMNTTPEMFDKLKREEVRWEELTFEQAEEKILEIGEGIVRNIINKIYKHF